MKIYRKIIIALAIILGIFTTNFILHGPAPQEAFNDPVTEEDYEFLKENALEVARTLDKSAVNDETLEAEIDFYADELVIKVVSTRAQLISKIPISNHLLKGENGTIQIQGTLEFGNVEYVKVSKLFPAEFYIGLAIFGGASIAGAIYMVFFQFWILLKQCVWWTIK